MSETVKGRVALVTGASRGIGREIALAMARSGADVAINYRNKAEAAREVLAEIRALGRKAVEAPGDVGDPSQIARIVAAAREGLGPVTILVNNAGIGTMRSADNITEADWDEMLAVNLKGAFLMTQAVLPDMRGAQWGRIIAISSTAAQTGGVVGPHYAASKAGLQGLMHYYAMHFAREGITANTIAPGPITTDMSAALPSLTPDSIPVGRFGKPGEIAEVAVLLAGNGFITGQTLNINGGRYPS